MEGWEDVAQELRSLWAVDTLNAETLKRLAPVTVAHFGHGDARLALTNLDDLLMRFSDDARMGALATALTLHPLVPQANVQGRFTHFGEHVLRDKRDERTVRRYAAQGADVLARRFKTAFGQELPSLSIGAALTDAGFKVRFDLTSTSDDQPVCLRVEQLRDDWVPYDDTQFVISTFDAPTVEWVMTPPDIRDDPNNVELHLWWLSSAPLRVNLDVQGVGVVQAHSRLAPDSAFVHLAAVSSASSTGG